MLSRLAKVADARSSMPMLANVTMRATLSGGVTFSATDLNVAMTIHAPAWYVQAHGGICVNAKSIATLVGKLPGDDVAIRVTARAGIPVVVITAGSVSMTLDGAPDRDAPILPKSIAANFASVGAGAFSEMFERTGYSQCKDETRFHLNGTLFECDGTTARTVTTDGHRLTKLERSFGTGPVLAHGVIIPAKGCATIERLLGSKAKGDCEIATAGHYLFVRYMGTELALKLIDAQFPPYLQVIPNDHERLATMDRKGLIAALERAKLLCTATRGVKLTIGNGGCTLTSDSPDAGVSVESIKAEGCGAEGKPFSFGINAGYLIESLAEITDKMVTIAYGSELDPVLVRGTEDACSYAPQSAPFLAVVMPMRI